MSTLIHGARCAFGPNEAVLADIEVSADRITRIRKHPAPIRSSSPGSKEIDLSGFLLMPGLINAHDHLHFSLFPRLANPPYQNYIEWGEDIHATLGEVIALHNSVPRNVRLWWGGIRNLLCGVTTVCHHDLLWPELRRSDFPVRVLQRYGWAHSPALGGELHPLRAATPVGCPFFLHACEGVDETARRELWQLDWLGLLDEDAVLVHALALDAEGAALLQERKTSIILCPSSNQFLFGTTPHISLLSGVNYLALGSDSPLTSAGDLLDEVRFATRACNLSSGNVYRMVTEVSAKILRLNNGEGSIMESGTANFFALRDTGDSPAETLQTLSAADVEFVMIGGRVQLASEAMVERFPFYEINSLEPLSINGTTRWLRAPVARLLQEAEQVLGRDDVRLGGKPVSISARAAVAHG